MKRTLIDKLANQNFRSCHKSASEAKCSGRPVGDTTAKLTDKIHIRIRFKICSCFSAICGCTTRRLTPKNK